MGQASTLSPNGDNGTVLQNRRGPNTGRVVRTPGHRRNEGQRCYRVQRLAGREKAQTLHLLTISEDVGRLTPLVKFAGEAA